MKNKKKKKLLTLPKGHSPLIFPPSLLGSGGGGGVDKDKNGLYLILDVD